MTVSISVFIYCHLCVWTFCAFYTLPSATTLVCGLTLFSARFASLRLLHHRVQPLILATTSRVWASPPAFPCHALCGPSSLFLLRCTSQFAMPSGKHQGLPQIVDQRKKPPDPPKPSGSGTRPPPSQDSKTRRQPADNRSRSRSPVRRLSTSSSGSSGPSEAMLTSAPVSAPASDSPSPIFTFLLQHYLPQFQSPKLLLQQFLKYIPRSSIHQILPTRNGMLIKTTTPDLFTHIRNKHSLEIFGPSATVTALNGSGPKQPPPPRKPPALSVVIRGVDPALPDTEIESELKLEGHNIIKAIRIRNDAGPTFMVRVLTNDQLTIDDLLHTGAYIYKRRYRVEPSRSSAPLPLRCDKCQTYNSHPTSACPNTPKCAFCSAPHETRSCPNLAQPPKCAQCSDPHPTYSYKCKSRPPPEPSKPELTVPLRTTSSPPTPPPSPSQPITIHQLLSFVTLALQNTHPFLRPLILQNVQHAARNIFGIHFFATYSGPHVHFSSQPLESLV